MPFALLFFGMILVITGMRDTYKQLGSMVVGDFTGQRGGAGFVMFAAAIGLVGALGAIKELRSFSHYFLALIIVSLLLHNAGVLQRFLAGLKSATAATPVPTTPGAQATPTVGGTSLFGGGGTQQACGPGSSRSVITGQCIPSVTVS